MLILGMMIEIELLNSSVDGGLRVGKTQGGPVVVIPVVGGGLVVPVVTIVGGKNKHICYMSRHPASIYINILGEKCKSEYCQVT